MPKRRSARELERLPLEPKKGRTSNKKLRTNSSGTETTTKQGGSPTIGALDICGRGRGFQLKVGTVPAVPS